MIDYTKTISNTVAMSGRTAFLATLEIADDDTPPWDVVAASADESVRSIRHHAIDVETSETPLPGGEELAKALLACALDLSQDPKPTEVLVTIAGKRAFARENISGIIARSKLGKSATVGAVLAAILAGSAADERETLKFRAVDNPGQAVIVIDTEQCAGDAHAAALRSLTRAGLTKNEQPDWLYFISASGWSPAHLQGALAPLMAMLNVRHNGIFAVLLDGGADFVSAVNDEQQSNSFWTFLTALAARHKCAIVSVVHSNEGAKASADARGHLGKQLHRKCETSLFLSREGDVTTITSEVMRGAPLTAEDGVCFSWDNTVNRHRLCASPLAAKEQAKKREMIDLARAIFCDKPDAMLKNSEIIALIRDREECSPATAANRLKAMIFAGAVSHNTLTRLYTLKKQTT